MHDLLENNTVHVLAQHVKEEPVAHLALLDDGVDDLSLDEPESNVEEVGAHPRTDDYHETIDDDERREHAQNEKPEPQENVNLFIDDVQLAVIGSRQKVLWTSSKHPPKKRAV